MSSRNCISSKLSLPIFLASRNRIQTVKVKDHISKNLKNYLRPIESSDDEIENNEPANESEDKKYKIVTSFKTKTRSKTWKLAPNRYNIPSQIGKNVKCLAWTDSKGTRNHVKKDMLRNSGTFYEVSTNFYEKLKHKCNKHKGKLGSNPRDRRPTTRFMVSNPVLCWRSTADPGPTSYFKGVLLEKMNPKTSKKDVVPHRFQRRSCIPESVRANFIQKSAFDPAPGRYELQDDENSLKICLVLEKEKRNRFRRLDFKRIEFQKTLLNPVRRHIFGYGFTRLFKGASLRLTKTSSKKYYKVHRDVNLYPSADYIRMITNPDRNMVSIGSEELSKQPHSMRFNCLVKFRIRRQLQDNKKVVFGSGVPRFKSLDISQPKKTKTPHPVVNQPVMKVKAKDIKSKLFALPERLSGTHKMHRMQPFKFQPIPNVKLLLDEKEVHPENENLEKYPKNLNPMEFLK